MKHPYPAKIFNNYRAIKKCALVKNKEITDESLDEFEMLLNDAQPSAESDMVEFNSMKALYMLNKHKFIELIRDTKLEALILWTESKSIVNSLHLSGIAYVSYDPTLHKYRVEKHRNIAAPRTPTQYNHFVQPRNTDIGVTNFPILNNAFSTLGDENDEDAIQFKN